MLNSEGQVAWRIVGRHPSGLILRECVRHMRIGEQIGGRLTPSLSCDFRVGFDVSQRREHALVTKKH
jgi:hypothetical protein